jgi:hypothetical protein
MSTAFNRYIYNRTYTFQKNLTIPIATSPTREQINDCYYHWKVPTTFTTYNVPSYSRASASSSSINTQNNVNDSWETTNWKCHISNNEQNKKAAYYPNSMPMSTNMRTAKILKYQQTQVPTIFAIY